MSIHDDIQQEAFDQRVADMKFLLDCQSGRRFIFDLLDSTGAFDQSFTGNSGSFFNDGKKAVGLKLFHEVMRLEPNRFTQMWQEHQDAEAQAKAQLDESED